VSCLDACVNRHRARPTLIFFAHAFVIRLQPDNSFSDGGDGGGGILLPVPFPMSRSSRLRPKHFKSSTTSFRQSTFARVYYSPTCLLLVLLFLLIVGLLFIYYFSSAVFTLFCLALSKLYVCGDHQLLPSSRLP